MHSWGFALREELAAPCSRLSSLLYGALNRALHVLLKLAFLFLFLQIPSLVSANTHPP